MGITPSLVVVDAWIDTVPGGLQVKNPQKAREAVAPWREYAAETGAAILLVAHTNRLESQDIRNTYGLSGALRQVARSTIYALEDPDTKALLVGPDKSNLGANGVAHRFVRAPIQHFPPTEESDGKRCAVTVSVSHHSKRASVQSNCFAARGSRGLDHSSRDLETPLTFEVPITLDRVDRHTADHAHNGEHESLGVGIVD